MNEIEAAQALGEIARARKAAGLPGLDEFAAARFLAEAAQLRALPETAGRRAAVPAPRRSSRTTRKWLSRQ